MPAASSSPHTQVPSFGCGVAVCVLLMAFGLLLLWTAQQRWQAGRTSDAWLSATFGAVSCLAGAGLLVPMQSEVTRMRARATREAAHPEEPWTWNEAWVQRTGILQSGRRHGRALLAIGLVFLGLGVPISATLLPRELARGNAAALLALVFPLFGVVVLVTALRDAWRRRKYGRARFVPAALPIPLGGELTGMIVVDRPVLPSGEGRVALDCWVTTDSDSRGRRQSDENASHTERAVARAEWTTARGQSQLFVQLPVRGGSATSMTPLTVNTPVFEWRLRVEAPTPGADFIAEFVLPVFAVAGAVTSEAATPARSRVARPDIWRAAGIVEAPQPGAVSGSALCFPAGIGRGVIWTPLGFSLIMGAVAVVLGFSKAPLVLALAVGFFAAVPLLAVFPLWRGGGERVWVERGAICVQPARGSQRRIELADVQALETRNSVGVGSEKFYRVNIRRRPGREGFIGRTVAVASLVRGDEAAGEVQMWLQERGVSGDAGAAGAG